MNTKKTSLGVFTFEETPVRKLSRKEYIRNILGERPFIPIPPPPPPTALTLDGYDIVVRYSPSNNKEITLFNDRHNDGVVTEMAIDGVIIEPTTAYTFTDDYSHIIRYKVKNNRYLEPNLFQYCFNVSAFKLADTFISVTDYAFYYCADLTDVVLPDSVQYIGTHTFYACQKLKFVVLGKNLESIWDNAFAQCHSLKSITSYAPIAPYIGEEPSSGWRTFESVANGGILYHPRGSDYSYWMGSGIGLLGSQGWTAVEIDVPEDDVIPEETISDITETPENNTEE